MLDVFEGAFSTRGFSYNVNLYFVKNLTFENTFSNDSAINSYPLSHSDVTSNVDKFSTASSCHRVQRFWEREWLTRELTVVHAYLHVRRDLLKYPYSIGFFFLVMFLYLRKYFDISKDFVVFLPICCIFLTYWNISLRLILSVVPPI